MSVRLPKNKAAKVLLFAILVDQILAIAVFVGFPGSSQFTIDHLGKSGMIICLDCLNGFCHDQQL